MQNSAIFVVRITVDNERHALLIAERIVEDRLVATANIAPPHTAYRLQDGMLAVYEEFAITAVTTEANFDALNERLSRMAGVVVPGITAYQLVDSHPAFEPWIRDVTSRCAGCEATGVEPDEE
jgi:uncharacterized protein involved in tolerance to divalent cations